MPLRVILGQHPTNGTYGLWISKPGAEATSTNIEDFLFDPSRYAMRLYVSGVVRWLKIAENGTFSSPGLTTYNGIFSPITVTHNLGYIPIFLISGNKGSGITTTNIEPVYSKLGLSTPTVKKEYINYKQVTTAGVTTYLNDYDPVSNTANTSPQITYALYRNRWF